MYSDSPDYTPVKSSTDIYNGSNENPTNKYKRTIESATTISIVIGIIVFIKMTEKI